MKLILTNLLSFIIIFSFSKAQTDPSIDVHEKNNTFLEEFSSIMNLNGIGIELNYKGEVFSNLSGGMENRSVYLDNIDIVFDLNLDELIGWKGSNFKVHFLGNHGGDPAEYSGAAQGISNIAAFETWKLYQFWLEQNLFDNKLSLLFGLYDLNSEFDVRETSSIFINPSHGIGAEFALTGKNGPSIFPYTSLALRIKYNFSPSFDVKAAVFDGVPGDLNNPHGTHISLNKEDGLILTGELTYKSSSEEMNSDYFKYSVGGWFYSDKFSLLNSFEENFLSKDDPQYQRGNYGAYISAEKFLLPESENSTEGLAGFVRIGFADNNVNQVNAYYGAGIIYTGLIPGRDEDISGLAIASIRNNEKFISVMALEDFLVKNYEHIIELTYLFNAASWLKIQPDFQFVFNPTFCNCNTYSLAFGTRVEVAL